MILGHRAGCTLYFQLASKVSQASVIQQTHHLGVFVIKVDGNRRVHFETAEMTPFLIRDIQGFQMGAGPPKLALLAESIAAMHNEYIRMMHSKA